jgi:hypothetical protein
MDTDEHRFFDGGVGGAHEPDWMGQKQVLRFAQDDNFKTTGCSLLRTITHPSLRDEWGTRRGCDRAVVRASERCWKSGFLGILDLLKVAKHGKGEKIYLVRFHFVPPPRVKAKAVVKKIKRERRQTPGAKAPSLFLPAERPKPEGLGYLEARARTNAVV